MGKLKLLGIKTAMLTGDSQAAAMQAQEQVSGCKNVCLVFCGMFLYRLLIQYD